MEFEPICTVGHSSVATLVRKMGVNNSQKLESSQ